MKYKFCSTPINVTKYDSHLPQTGEGWGVLTLSRGYATESNDSSL